MTRDFIRPRGVQKAFFHKSTWCMKARWKVLLRSGFVNMVAP